MARITLTEVAADAGVSKATVSLVLRESPLVADSTRARVQESMARLGYVYHRGAASLRSKRSHTVGLLVTEVSNPFFAEFTVGAEAALANAGIIVLLGHNYESTQKQASLLHVMQEYGVDGLLVTPANSTTAADLSQLLAAKLPHVLVTRYVEGHAAPYAGADNVAGAKLVTAHVLQHGAKRVAFLGGPEQSSARNDRRSGVEAALAADGRNLPKLINLPTQASRQGGYDAATTLLSKTRRPDAIICYSDVVAFGVMLACERAGIRVGQDIIVTGFDDIGEAALQHPGLTTVSLNPRNLGHRAAHLLLEQIADQTVRLPDDISNPPLVTRGSCGCPDRDVIKGSVA